MRKCPALKWFTPSSRDDAAGWQSNNSATASSSPPIASWSDAIPFGRVAGCRGADLPRLIEEPAEPRTQKCQDPPQGRAMNIRPRAGETHRPDNPVFPNSGPFRKT